MVRLSESRIFYPLVFLHISHAQIDTEVVTSPEPTLEILNTSLEEQRCQIPSLTINGSNLHNEHFLKKVNSIVYEIKDDSKVLKCKLECRDGLWTGPYCSDSTFKYGCLLNYISPDLDVRDGFEPVVLQSSREFRHGTTLKIRCRDEEKHLAGTSRIACRNSMWTGHPPLCIDTSSVQDYSEKLPPRMEVNVRGSTHARGREGEIYISPGAILHIDCIFDRRRGTPQWSWSHSYREYPTGWLASEMDRNWKFRISIVYAKEEDSGRYNCTTPRGMENALTVKVTSKLCPQLEKQDHHRLSSTDRSIGTEVFISCPTGFHTLGASTVTCRDDGSWSDFLPVCVPVTCSPLEISSNHLRVLSLNNSYLGEAEFDCPFGYNLTGPMSIWCQDTGEWSGSVPDCTAIECGAPIAPENGEILETGTDGFLVGSTAQIICHAGFVLIGEPILRCTRQGIWSDATPICKRACAFPGTPRHGSIVPIKFIYSVGEKITVLCDRGSVSIGSSFIQCMPSGDWSGGLPKCESYS